MTTLDWLHVLGRLIAWLPMIAFGAWMRRDHLEARRQLEEIKERLVRLAELRRNQETPAQPNVVHEPVDEEPQPLPAATARYRARS